MTSSVAIGNPAAGISRSNSQKNAGALSGAMQGAAAGAAFGPWGAAIGGVVGAIGGLIGGGQLDRATLQKMKAAAWAETGKDREAAVARNQMLREYRAARADALAQVTSESGGGQGSAMGAISAIGSQYAFSDAFFGGQVRVQKKVAKHMRKAGKATASANTTFGIMDAAGSFASAVGNYGLSFGSKDATQVGLSTAQEQGAYSQIDSLFKSSGFGG